LRVEWSMRILATLACLCGLALTFAVIGGYSFAVGFRAVGWACSTVGLVLLISSIIITYDALQCAAALTVEWQARWGSEVGSAPRLLRSLLVTLESGLRVRPCRGDSMERRTERLLHAIANRPSSRQAEMH
jgi:hypothetical protein